jgi:hypothetical protein
MNTREFVSAHAIRAHVDRVDHNPNMRDSDWASSANHWAVTLSMAGKRMRVPYSTSSALSEPDAADVLDTLANDASGIWASQDFEDWANEYGYNTDSRAAHRTWELVNRQSKRLQTFLGVKLHRELLEDIERL